MFHEPPPRLLFAPARMKSSLSRKSQKEIAATGKAPIYLRLSYRGEVSYVATGVYLLKKEWDQASQSVRGKEDVHDAARAALRVWVGEAEKLSMQHRKTPGMTVADYKGLLLGKEEVAMTLLAAADAFYQNKARPEMKKAFATLRLYRTCRLALETYLTHLGALELPAVAVDKAWLRQLERWCVSLRGYALSTVRRYVGFVQEVLDFAAEEKWVPANPVENYRFEVSATPGDPSYLPEAEVQRLAGAALPRILDRARVAWLFCCYTGLSYVDYARFTAADVHADASGQRWIRMERQKTGAKVSIPVLPELDALLLRCNGAVPKLECAYFNRRLKDVSTAVGLSLPLTTGLARHTASHRLRNELGFTADEAAGWLGHSVQVQHSNYSRMREEGMSGAIKRVGLAPVAPTLRQQLEAALAAATDPSLRAKLLDLLQGLPD